MKVLLLAAALGLSTPAFAWYEHQYLMPLLISEEALAFGDQVFSAEQKRALSAPIPASCGAEDTNGLRRLESALQLHAGTPFGPTSAAACAAKRPTSGAEILSGSAVDDPDKGMDANLPDAFDPNGDREALGSKTGPGSQAFRHIYFRAWTPAHPILTLHFPRRVLGIAPKRLETLAGYAKAEIPRGKALPYRVLGWALHYIQDLSQPFHVVQTPSASMATWYALWTWPPNKGFADLGKETSRSVTNYHWAIEGYVRNRLMEKGEKNPFTECLTQSSTFTTLPDRASIKGVHELSEAMAGASVRLAPELGTRAVAFFGHDLTLRDKDFTQGQPQPPYSDLAIRPDVAEARRDLHETLCKCLANGAWASRWLIRHVLSN
jgi:hypothetical protein